MITAEGLVTAFNRNASYMQMHLDGLTHTDAVLQPPVTGNCILWIVGHILCYRNYVHELLNLDLAISAAHAARFARGSEPVLHDDPALPRLETLYAAYQASQAALVPALRALPETTALAVVTQGDFTMPRAELLMSYMRHESYHVGQLELLHELALAHRR
jgi:hypothetical protein